MALSAGAASLGATKSRILNRLAYDIANKASDVTTAATGDLIPIIDISADYEIKYADAANIAEIITGQTVAALGVTTLTLGGTAIAATAAEINAAADVSARIVQLTDADYTVLVANSGKPHFVPNVSADRTITMPAEAAGLSYEFIAQINAADGHDWIFDTGSNTNYFVGGVVHLDTDATTSAAEVVNVLPDGNSNSKLQINLPSGGTRIRFDCHDGVLWTVSGFAVSATAPAFADQ